MESWWVWRPGELSHESDVHYIRDRYNFMMTHPSGDTASVACLFRLPGSTTQVRGSAVQDIMTAYIRTNRDTAGWQLVMGAVAVNARSTKFELVDGLLFNAVEEYAVIVHTTWSDGKKPLLGPIGFEIFSGEESVAALQVGGFTRGMVWISTAVDGPRRHLLCAAVETLLMWVHNGGYEAKTYDYDRD